MDKLVEIDCALVVLAPCVGAQGLMFFAWGNSLAGALLLILGVACLALCRWLFRRQARQRPPFIALAQSEQPARSPIAEAATAPIAEAATIAPGPATPAVEIA